MKRISWQIILGIVLVVLSAAVYIIHYLFFRDVHHILIYLVGDIAFVFIEVLLVTLIIHRLLGEREKRAMLEKMNMVIGTFFSEVGTELLVRFSRTDENRKQLVSRLSSTKDFTMRQFEIIGRELKQHSYTVHAEPDMLVDLKGFLVGKRDFLLRLLANPNLLEHDSFTNLLWAVFHLTDELSHRKDPASSSQTDLKHLSGDITRAYRLLVAEWLDYMLHLKANYPYLFSLAMRTNPFDTDATVEV
ncbi:MAG: hypothetical protein JSW02_11095 [candidate division WOR-3 bacterium]|nr:MAG: hypothetical protein JSW02_11095 [candidate division WOR-3 bacterium]